MSQKLSQNRNRAWILGGLGSALIIAVCLSPFASKNPDGLDRVAQDLKLSQKEMQDKPAHKLPFYSLFDEYELRGVPQPLATPLAGLTGVLFTFGLAWGVGKLTMRHPAPTDETSSPK